MKILVSADLHYRSHWFHWLSERAANFDLICIAGDLLDMFKGAPRMEQAREVSRWIRELAKVTWIAICSGNHDDAGRPYMSGLLHLEESRRLSRMGDADCERFDRNNGSVSLFKKAEVGSA
jgi:DNA repair exonuclease SbcCD nuclease subunit